MHYKMEDVIFWWFDFYVHNMLQLHFAPYYLMSKGRDAEQWISHFSTNGMKQFNLCRP